MTDGNESPYMATPASYLIYADPLCLALWDPKPRVAHHAVVLPRRCVASWFETTEDERTSLYLGLEAVHAVLQDVAEYDRLDVRMSLGGAGDRGPRHFHIDVLPLSACEMPAAKGAMHPASHVLLEPVQGQLWGEMAPGPGLVTGGEEHLLDYLLLEFDKATRVDIAVAFVLRSGVELLVRHCRELLERSRQHAGGAVLRIVTGDYLHASDPDAMRRVLDLGDGVDFRVYETSSSSFHPKTYIFHHDDLNGVAFIGSSNMSRTGLTHGVEWNYRALSSGGGTGFHEAASAFEELLSRPQVKPVTSECLN